MISQWLGIIGGLVGLVVFLGAAVIYLRGSKDQGTIATLESSNRALTERVKVLEDNETRLTARVEALERENAALLSQRPSAEAIRALHDDLRKHDEETKALLTKGTQP